MDSFLIILGLAVAAFVAIVRNSAGYASYKQSIETRTDTKSPPVTLIEKEESDNEEQLYPYKRRSLLTANERIFFKVLEEVVGDQYVIFAQVSLLRLMNISREFYWQHEFRNKIARKTVDFVLCDPDSLSAILVIELDDSSHDREDRRQRDDFVDKALSAADLPIVHIRARRNYDSSEIAATLREYM